MWRSHVKVAEQHAGGARLRKRGTCRRSATLATRSSMGWSRARSESVGEASTAPEPSAPTDAASPATSTRRWAASGCRRWDLLGGWLVRRQRQQHLTDGRRKRVHQPPLDKRVVPRRLQRGRRKGNHHDVGGWRSPTLDRTLDRPLICGRARLPWSVGRCAGFVRLYGLAARSLADPGRQRGRVAAVSPSSRAHPARRRSNMPAPCLSHSSPRCSAGRNLFIDRSTLGRLQSALSCRIIVVSCSPDPKGSRDALYDHAQPLGTANRRGPRPGQPHPLVPSRSPNPPAPR